MQVPFREHPTGRDWLLTCLRAIRGGAGVVGQSSNQSVEIWMLIEVLDLGKLLLLFVNLNLGLWNEKADVRRRWWAAIDFVLGVREIDSRYIFDFCLGMIFFELLEVKGNWDYHMWCLKVYTYSHWWSLEYLFWWQGFKCKKMFKSFSRREN